MIKITILLIVSVILSSGCVTTQDREPDPATGVPALGFSRGSGWAWTEDRSGRVRWTNRPGIGNARNDEL